MIQYPSIPSVARCRGLGKPCIAFYKYDGSNLRFEWSPKRNWHKFGSRTQLIDQNTEQFKGAIPLFMDTMSKDIVEIIRDEFGSKALRIVAFAEYYGPSSFAGFHDPNEPKQLKLFDVSVYKQGFLPAKQFVELFGDKEWSAEVEYTGNLNQPFINDVRHGAYPVYEGVVCKGVGWNAKIKTFEYLNRLKHQFDDEWEKYAE